MSRDLVYHLLLALPKVGVEVGVVLDTGDFYISTFDSTNHYEANILRLEKWDKAKIWTAIVRDEMCIRDR